MIVAAVVMRTALSHGPAEVATAHPALRKSSVIQVSRFSIRSNQGCDRVPATALDSSASRSSRSRAWVEG